MRSSAIHLPEPSESLTVSRSVELSIIIPTLQERENIPHIVEKLDGCLSGVAWEVVFVDDDSPDGTAEAVREIGRRDRRVRCVQRIGRRGLASACIEGFLASSAPFLAVMDGDLQHDERLLPDMLKALKGGETDVVVGSRYAVGGGIGNWDPSRAAISRFATQLSRLVVKADLTDPMSGFFMTKQDVVHGALRSLSGIGFKILVDLFASSRQPLRFLELPYRFRSRVAGASKLDSQAAWEYFQLLLDKLVGHVLPVRFVTFSLVGAVGVCIHMLVLTGFYRGMDLDFVLSQSFATMVAMTSNYSINNILTYRDMRLTGRRWWYGLLSFSVACSVGATANVGIAAYLFEHNTAWAAAALAGVVVGAVWNYAVTSVYTWRRPFGRPFG